MTVWNNLGWFGKCVGRIFVILLICALSNVSFSQAPNSHFLYLYDWGEGGPISTTTKVDQIYNINVLEDGYIFCMFTFCDLGNCVKYVKIDQDGEVLWELSFNDADFNYNGAASSQNDIIIDDTLISILHRSDSTAFENNIFLFIKINTSSGELIHLNEIDRSTLDIRSSVHTIEKYNDSTIVISSIKTSFNDQVYPVLRFLDLSGKVVDKINYTDFLPSQSAFHRGLNKRPDSTFAGATAIRDDFTSLSGELFYTTFAISDAISEHQSLNYHTADFGPFVISFLNGNNLIVSGIDTFWNDEFNTSEIYSHFLISDSFDVIDSIWYFPDLISYRVKDVDISRNEKALVVGESRALFVPGYNRTSIFFLQYDSNGEVVLHKEYAPYEYAHKENRLNCLQIKEDIDGGFLIVGSMSFVTDTNAIDNGRKRFAYILKVDSSGCFGDNCDGGILLSTKILQASEPELILDYGPNPFSNFIEIRTPDYIADEINIISSNGIFIKKYRPHSNRLTLNSENWSSGLYFIHVKKGSKTIVRPCIRN